MIRNLFFVLAASVWLAVCQTANATSNESTIEKTRPLLLAGAPGASSVAALMNTEWLLREITGDAFSEGTDVSRARITLHSKGNRVSGSSGCNRLMGDFELRGDQLKFGQMGMTRMACPGDYMKLEMAFNKMLSQVHSWQVMDGKMLLLGTGGILATFQSAGKQ